MRWPRATAPAWPVHAGFAGAVVLFGIAYAMAGQGARTVIFSLTSRLPSAATMIWLS